jgi:hypothetical protein
VREQCKINVEIHVIKLLRQRVSATPRAKIEVIPISDADCAETSNSPISSLVYRSRYPRAISSLVIPKWVIERQTLLPVVMVINTMKVQMRSQYKFKDEEAWKEER